MKDILQINIFCQMPSLIVSNQKLVFGGQWPLSKVLPPIPSMKILPQLMTEEACAIQNETSIKNKSIMQITKCPHKNRKHYAKNMCNDCYHKKGRQQKATKCKHTKHNMYAKGLCVRCYQNAFNKSKKLTKF